MVKTILNLAQGIALGIYNTYSYDADYDYLLDSIATGNTFALGLKFNQNTASSNAHPREQMASLFPALTLFSG